MRLNVLVSLIVLVFSSSLAQEVSHQVSVSLPNILRLKIDKQQTASSADVAVQVIVKNGAFEITPAHTTVEVLANSDWQLSASYQPDTRADAAAKLSWAMNGVEKAFTSYPSVLAGGKATNGWQGFDLEYGLAALPADGIYGGTVTYTLARP